MARRTRNIALAAALAAAAGAALLAPSASSEEGTAEDAGAGVRCATRLSNALLGTSASPDATTHRVSGSSTSPRRSRSRRLSTTRSSRTTTSTRSTPRKTCT